MSNRRMTMSAKGTERLDKIMAELNISNRPDAFRIAFAKGLTEAEGEPPEPEDRKGFTIPDGVVATDETYQLYKHLIIEKLGRPIETNEEVDQYLLKYIELGLVIMENEINSLSNLDNYLLYLVEKVRMNN